MASLGEYACSIVAGIGSLQDLLLAPKCPLTVAVLRPVSERVTHLSNPFASRATQVVDRLVSRRKISIREGGILTPRSPESYRRPSRQSERRTSFTDRW